MSVGRLSNRRRQVSVPTMNQIPDTVSKPLAVSQDQSFVNSFNGDESNIAILMFLYVLQGIPLGIAATVPLILTNKHASYHQLAQFSFATWPFSIKLLWAPIVDGLYIKRFGRRKSWLVPVQYVIGFAMIALSFNVAEYLDRVDVGALTAMFFALNFLAATQDIAVDGWALTMLKPQNVGWASTCNSVGQTAGYFMGYVLYMGLESYGILTLADFLLIWGIIFLVVTTLVALWKHESPVSASSMTPFAEVMLTYRQLAQILKLHIMPTMIMVLLTCKIAFSAIDSISTLKLVEAGVPKETLTMLAVPLMPLQILLPLFISRYLGSRPLDVYLRAIPYRLLIGVVVMSFVYFTPWFAIVTIVEEEESTSTQFSTVYYALLLLIYGVHQIFSTAMFVSIMAFFAQISDPAIGGTYMTLLNTLTNLGGNWPSTLSLWLVDSLTTKDCVSSMKENNATIVNNCDTPDAVNSCTNDLGGRCVVMSDGYYTEAIFCTLFGFAWLLLWGKRTLRFLQATPSCEWLGSKDVSAPHYVE